MQPLNAGQLQGQPHHSTAHREFPAVIGEGKHLSGLAQGQQPHPVANGGHPAPVLAPLRGGAVLLLKRFEPLAGLAGGFA